MPTPSPLTQSPMPLLDDTANIETAVPPGMLSLERFVTARFSSTSARNAAFSAPDASPPQVGQMVYVASLGHLGYQCWNGSQWEEFGDFTWMRRHVATTNERWSRTSTVAANVPQLSLHLTPASYSVELHLIYSTEETNLIEINFNFPHPDSRMSMGVIGRSPVSGGTSANSTESTFLHHQTRVSGDLAFQLRGAAGWIGNTLRADFRGRVRVNGSGNLNVTARRVGGSGGSEVRVWGLSRLEVQKYAA